jgi:uncharacterized protein YaiL (DUF2058 family)
MSMSLRDQLIAAGLVTEKHARQVSPPVKRQQQSKSKPPPLPAATLAAQRAQAEKFARDQALNRRRQEKAERKARMAQARQLIDENCLPRVEGDDYFNFVDAGKIKRIAVNPSLREQLQRGELLIARCGERYDLVPASAAERIRERGATVIAPGAEPPVVAAEDEVYKDFIVPDDLKW